MPKFTRNNCSHADVLTPKEKSMRPIEKLLRKKPTPEQQARIDQIRLLQTVCMIETEQFPQCGKCFYPLGSTESCPACNPLLSPEKTENE